jgi:general stress protein YciG
MAHKSKRGFAAMSSEKQREIARKGGKASRGKRSSRKDKGIVDKASDLVGF